MSLYIYADYVEPAKGPDVNCGQGVLTYPGITPKQFFLKAESIEDRQLRLASRRDQRRADRKARRQRARGVKVS